MNKGGFMAFLKSPATKVGGVCVVFLLISLFSSWATQKTIAASMSDYAKFQFSASVESVLKQKDGVMDQLASIKDIATDAKSGVDTINNQNYEAWIVDINKYYTQITTGHDESMTSAHQTKISNYWKYLPASYKTDLLTAHYNFVFNWITDNCK